MNIIANCVAGLVQLRIGEEHVKMCMLVEMKEKNVKFDGFFCAYTSPARSC